MKFPPRTQIPFFALGAILSGCSCGTYHPESGKSADLSSSSPVGSYTNTETGATQVKCDSKRNCTLTFKDGTDSSTTWTVDFTLDSSKQITTHASRDL